MTDVQRTDSAAETATTRSGASALLTSPGFVVAVALLLLNDWVLKPTVGGWWTGKLSDFAGLFAFPLFWAALLPRQRRVIYVLTALGFLAWKSPLSDPPLAAWNGLGLWPLARVIDYSDWIALAALLPSYRLAWRYLGVASARPLFRTRGLARRAGAVATGGIAVLAFAATSRPREMPRFPSPNEGYVFAYPKSEVRTQLDSLRTQDRHLYVRGPRSGSADTLFLSFGDARTDQQERMTIELRETADGGTVITLLAAAPRVRALSRAEDFALVRRAFEEQVIGPLRARLARSRAPAG